jgi:creatinine amidohydrolase/Fe(II)-dependent formamide hydrolase-like protein
LAYHGPAIAIDTDAARAAMFVERIRARCPELTNADLLLVARVLADHQRVKEGKAAPKRPTPAKKRA